MKRWYVVQVYAGYEERVKQDVLKRISEQGLEDAFGDVLIPSAKMKQYFSATDVKDQQLFPGYLLVQMDLDNQTQRLIQSAPRVIRFLGGTQPVALSQKEIDRILAQIHGEFVVAADKADFVVGHEVDIIDGPFAGFVGMVDTVDQDDEKLTVMVSIFGRLTPVELRFDQVKQ